MRAPARPAVPVRLAAAAAAGLLALAGCGSSPQADPVRDTATDVPFARCGGEVACTGTLEGAKYEIMLPERWNGTLLLYSHGYRPAVAVPPDLRPPSTDAEASPGAHGEGADLARQLLARGYALAGSAYKTNGWAVADGVAAAEQLHGYFADKVAAPRRVYLWGDSLGGLITQVVAEKHPDWVSGAAPLCGALAGIAPNMDLALDAAYAMKRLLVPNLTITGFSSADDAVAAWRAGFAAILAAAPDVSGGGTAALLLIAALVDAPSQTQRYDGSTVESKVRGTAEALATALGFATFGRQDVQSRFGGEVSDNTATDYAARITAADRSLVDSVGGAGTTDRLLAKLRDGRVAADPSARARALAEGGDPQGAVQVPTITLHTAADPLVVVQNQAFFRVRYDAAAADGRATADLVQLFTVPPATYPETGAPYGAGHCNFTGQSRLAVVDLLDAWVRTGTYPASAAVAKAMGTDSGLSPAFTPPAWPAGPDAPQASASPSG